jgi:hypothetical protein
MGTKSRESIYGSSIRLKRGGKLTGWPVWPGINLPGKSRVFSAVHSTFELCAAPPDDNMPHLAKGFV